MLHEITNKFCVRFDSKAKRGKKKDELSDEELKWIKEFLDRPDISYMNPKRKDHVYVGKKDGVKCTNKNVICYGKFEICMR